MRAGPGNPEAVCRLAQAVDNIFYSYGYGCGYGTAVALLESLPASARQTTEVRVTLGDLHREAGNFALAAAAYGDPRDLDRYDRRSRRSSMRRGLLQRRRSSNPDRDTRLDLTTFNPVDVTIAHVLDKADSLRDRPGECSAMLETAVAEHGQHPLLLLYLARAELRADDRHSCAALATEALTSAPGKPADHRHGPLGAVAIGAGSCPVTLAAACVVTGG